MDAKNAFIKLHPSTMRAMTSNAITNCTDIYFFCNIYARTNDKIPLDSFEKSTSNQSRMITNIIHKNIVNISRFGGVLRGSIWVGSSLHPTHPPKFYRKMMD